MYQNSLALTLCSSVLGCHAFADSVISLSGLPSSPIRVHCTLYSDVYSIDNEKIIGLSFSTALMFMHIT